MKKFQWRMAPMTLLVVFTPILLCAQQKPIALHPQNQHYFLYKDKPSILITSAEHYGVVLNLDFDYTKYLDALASKGLNLTRVFTGAYVEPQGAFKIEKNTLAPLPGRFICPWLRSDEPGYANGGNKFDLSRWDEAYFERLKGFMEAAEKRNVIVELALFCPFYEDMQWKLSPLNSSNNMNSIGSVERTKVYTLDQHGGLLSVQETMVRKIINELKEFSNLIYEICNEPYFGGVTMEWQHHIANIIREEEKMLGVTHLISQNIANGSEEIKDPHPDVSVFNFHYAFPPTAVAVNYHLNKVIGDNETGFKGNNDSTYRREGWAFIMAGGGLYNNLDYSFTAGHEDGTFKYPSTQPGGGSDALRRQLGYLMKFVHGFDFIKMTPTSMMITDRLEGKADSWLLAEPGKQYAGYIFGGKQVSIEIVAPAGKYKLEWLNPLTGKTDKIERVRSNGRLLIRSPLYTEDIAFRLTR